MRLQMQRVSPITSWSPVFHMAALILARCSADIGMTAKVKQEQIGIDMQLKVNVH